MDINPSIFREYDIRGIVDRDLTPAIVETLGRGIGTYFLDRGRTEVALGRDCRLSSPAFGEAMTKGLLAAGCDVTDLGIIPTPLLYFTVFHKKKPAGVMITGSHNPPEHNGFKMMAGEETLYGPDIQDIYRLVAAGRFREGRGKRAIYDIRPEYLDYVAGGIRLERPLKVVIDAGNGTGGTVGVPLLRRLGAEVVERYCDMDGRFPHHHPDPTLPEAMADLIQAVSGTRAEAGIAYDGDADRIGVVDDAGRILWGDQLMVVFARDILPRHPGAAVISEVKASQVLYDEIARLGGKPVMWKAGHSLIKKKIKEERAVLAGEMSGHIFFADRWFGFDDAIYASARLLEILSRSPRRLSEMLADLPRTYTTPEIRIYASDEAKFRLVEAVKKDLASRHPIIDIDGVRAIFPKGWGLVRASNTQAVIVLRFEAATPEDLESIQKEVRASVAQAARELGDA